LKQVINELSDVGKRDAGRYQPEISLAVYAERADAFRDEVHLLTKVIPSVIFPWELSGEISKSEGKLPMLKKQLNDLYNKIKTNKQVLEEFQEVFIGVYGDYGWNPPWTTEVSPIDGTTGGLS
jgi:hypothetical protein